MKNVFYPGLILMIVIIATAISCNKDSAVEDTSTVGTTDITSVVQSNYIGTSTVAVSGSGITIKSTGLPNHKTPYWGV
ncbi:MAG: hypothetical protein IPL55_13910 [Saprospiraceae bacterium]|nr:hypothetical protein [Saprospiraceae bacterium]